MKKTAKLVNSIIKNPVFQQYIVWRNAPPFSGWHSWDPHPWNHPWLTIQNLSAMREYSAMIRENAKKIVEQYYVKDFHFGFLGNMANNLYMRAVPLRRAGTKISLFMNPHDNYVMSHPSWEEFAGTIKDEETDIRVLRRQSEYRLPKIEGVEHPLFGNVSDYLSFESKPSFFSAWSFLRYPSYRFMIPFLSKLQKMDALYCAQFPYIAHLSGRPYVVSQVGGDIWLDASRGDELGKLQRAGFKNASLFLVSNPWSFAHARRLGFRHLIYLPLMLDQHTYSPGDGELRGEWEAISKGSFFVLTTTRLDEEYKGSRIALEGIAAFLHKYPEARVVIIGWGKDETQGYTKLKDYGVVDKIIWLPLSGKKLVRHYLRSADCFIDQFVLGYFGAASLEAMACGLPVIARIEREQYNALCETGAPPIMNAKTSQDIFNHLSCLFENTNKRKELSRKHREWFLANHGSERWVTEYQNVLNIVALNKKLNLTQSPLQCALHSAELEYHREGLRNAPVFPNYFPLKPLRAEKQ